MNKDDIKTETCEEFIWLIRAIFGHCFFSYCKQKNPNSSYFTNIFLRKANEIWFPNFKQNCTSISFSKLFLSVGDENNCLKHPKEPVSTCGLCALSVYFDAKFFLSFPTWSISSKAFSVKMREARRSSLMLKDNASNRLPSHGAHGVAQFLPLFDSSLIFRCVCVHCDLAMKGKQFRIASLHHFATARAPLSCHFLFAKHFRPKN